MHSYGCLARWHKERRYHPQALFICKMLFLINWRCVPPPCRKWFNYHINASWKLTSIHSVHSWALQAKQMCYIGEFILWPLVYFQKKKERKEKIESAVKENTARTSCSTFHLPVSVLQSVLSFIHWNNFVNHFSKHLYALLCMWNIK